MIQFSDLSFGYNAERPIGKINVSCKAGAMIALLGANGSGKSTLLQTIAGILPPLDGTINFNIANLKISYLPQYVQFERQFPITVMDMMLMGYLDQVGFWRGVTAAQRQRAVDALALVDLAHCINMNIAELSGGQMQRVLFARLLLEQAQLVLLDEPFSGVDIYSIHVLLDILIKLQQQGATIITAMHDWNLAKAHFEQLLWLKNGSAILGTSQELFESEHCCEPSASAALLVTAGEMV